MKFDYDVAVIGAGSGGLTVAFGLSAAGKKVALIEGGPIGGDCTNFGCVPSKALIDISKHSPELGFKKALELVRERREIIQDEESPDKIESKNLKLFQGFASFKDDNTLNITDSEKSQITAKKIVIASGSKAKKIEIKGVKAENILTNEEIFEQTDDIKNLVIIGGGYIGCELAESIAALGVTVHLVQRNKDLVPNEEQESRDLLRKIFEEKGIKVHTEMTATSGTDTEIILTSKDEKMSISVPYDKVLMALGRQANTQKLNLDTVEVNYSKKGITVNKYNKTNKKHIFAIGDCVENNPQFTHWANNEGRGVVRNILVPIHNSSVRKAALPAVLYTHREVARVGKTQEELLKKYARDEFVTKIQYFESNDRSKVTSDTTGFIKIHFTRLTGKILGATIFGTNAGEMLPVITSAMDNKMSAYKLSKTVFPYPTKSDLVKRIMSSFVTDTLGNIQNELKFFLKNNIFQLLTAIIWISFVGTFLWYKISTQQSFEDIALGIYNFLRASSLGPILFIAVYTIRPIVLFPGSLMTFMGGALFGPIFGILYTVLAGTASAIFAYFLGMVFGKKLLSDTQGGIIGTLKGQLDNEPFMSVLMTRLLFFPFDIVNYACGFLKANFPKFTLATFVGIIPGTSVFVLAGAAFYGQEITSLSQAIQNVDTKLLLAAAGLFIVITVFAKLLRKFKR